MYNRYIPQPDGSYKRKLVQDERRMMHNSPPKTEDFEPSRTEPYSKQDKPSPAFYPGFSPTQRPIPPHIRKDPSNLKIPELNAGAFLRNLIPKNLDTGDLLVIVLLLLMSGDSREEQNNALLTLALYLFL